MKANAQRNSAHTQSGLTLLELMIGIFVLAILLGVGVPGFQDIVRNNRLTAQTNDLVTALNVARSEAVKRGLPVSVCASADQASCAASTTWTTGWILFTDNTGAAGAVDGTDAVLQSWQSLSGPSTLTSTVNFVQFQPTGRANAAAAFDLLKPGCTGPYARNISIGVSGRVDSDKVNCP